ncbi:2'-deoxycytidine 5'-triphosphate deaminase [Methylobacterium fujisawaense]
MTHVPNPLGLRALPAFASGTQPDSAIRLMADAGMIASDIPFVDGQIQPASLDLRLGAKAWRVRASFLPGSEATVRQRIDRLGLFEIDLTDGAVLETGCVYVAELQERIALPSSMHGAVNPKSSTGRLDVFTRVLADHAAAFDTVAPGYVGPLYAEIAPGVFPVVVRKGSRLSQIRFRHGRSRLSDAETATLHAADPLTDAPATCFQNGVAFSMDLQGFGPERIAGYKARPYAGIVDFDKVRAHPREVFWEPIPAPEDGLLVLDPGAFYIFASKEALSVPPDYSAEMIPFDPLLGEARWHLAGFFDAGFGHARAGGAGSRGVLEIRCRDVPFAVTHGQVVGRLVYERMAARPERLYGAEVASNYQRQGLALGKHFT